MVFSRILFRSSAFPLILKRSFASTNKMTEHKFKEYEVIPNVVQHAPADVMDIKYHSGVDVNLGHELKPRQVKDEPKVKWNADANALYTLVLTDPDAPSRKDPKNAEWKHWLVVNIPGCKVKEGQVVAEYVGSGPPQGTGLHRYVFLAYRQPAKITIDEHLTKHIATGRAHFKIANFAEQHKLGEPVSGNFYQAEWDDYVPELYKQFTG